MKFIQSAATLAFGAVIAGQAGAAPVTSTAGFGTTKVVDFSQYAVTCASPYAPGCQGPVNVGGLVGETVTYTGTSGVSLLYNGDFGLGNNGYWNGGRNGYAAIDRGSATFMQFAFGSGPVSAVGGFVNYAPGVGDNALMEVLDQFNNVLEAYDIAALALISTPDALNAGAFRGILRSSADIYAVRYSNNYLVLDDLTFARGAAVPEPASLGLVGLALVGLAAARRRGAAAS